MPCQMWTIAFFDKKNVENANALTVGFGNARGGITYLLMPTIFDSLDKKKTQHLSDNVAWRTTFIVPVICITATVIAMILFCPDTPRGKWSDRQFHANPHLTVHGPANEIMRTPPDELANKQTKSLHLTFNSIIIPLKRSSPVAMMQLMSMTLWCSHSSRIRMSQEKWWSILALAKR